MTEHSTIRHPSVQPRKRPGALEHTREIGAQFEAQLRVAMLSEPQRALLEGVLAGYSTVELADHLGVSPSIVRWVTYRTKARLDAKSNADLVRIAIYAGMDADLTC
jgi:DNA-binding CsgD family transcriptional regulator